MRVTAITTPKIKPPTSPDLGFQNFHQGYLYLIIFPLELVL